MHFHLITLVPERLLIIISPAIRNFGHTPHYETQAPLAENDESKRGMFSDRLVCGGCWQVNKARRGREHPSRQGKVVVAIVTPVCWSVYQPRRRGANATSAPGNCCIRLRRDRAFADLGDNYNLESRKTLARLTEPTSSTFQNFSESNVSQCELLDS